MLRHGTFAEIIILLLHCFRNNRFLTILRLVHCFALFTVLRSPAYLYIFLYTKLAFLSILYIYSRYYIVSTNNVVMNKNLYESVLAMKQNFGSANSRAPYVQEITLATPPVENLHLHKISWFIYFKGIKFRGSLHPRNFDTFAGI